MGLKEVAVATGVQDMRNNQKVVVLSKYQIVPIHLFAQMHFLKFIKQKQFYTRLSLAEHVQLTSMIHGSLNFNKIDYFQKVCNHAITLLCS